MDAQEAKKRHAAAQQLFREGRYEEALTLVDQLERAYPNEPNVLFAKARCLNALGRHDEARAICVNLAEKHNHRRAAELLTQIDLAQASPAAMFDVPESKPSYTPPATPQPASRKWVAVLAAGVAIVVAAGAAFVFLPGGAEDTKVAEASLVRQLPVPDRPTYTKDVAPILNENCVVCHRPGEAVPMSLMTYEQIRPWAKSIRTMVESRQMPPWHADPSVGKWSNDRRLSDRDLTTIVRWIDQGATRGNPEDAPEPPTFTDGWKIGEPDVVFTAGMQSLPASLEDEYRYIFVPTGFTQDRWISAAEVRPGNMDVVHHVIVFTADPAKGRNGLEASLGGFAPGSPPLELHHGRAMKIGAGHVLVLQMHYHKEPGAAAQDRTSIGLKFARGTVRKQVRFGTIGNENFVIPPRDAFYPVQASEPVKEDIHIEQIVPHMHLRGKDMKVWAKYPDGYAEDLLLVPNYDFNWQTFYEAEEPIAIPAGSVLNAYAHYDNSAGNPFNPDPNAEVRWGEPTTAEMMYAFFTYTVDDENLKVKDPGS